MPPGDLLAPIICNFVLSNLTKEFFNDTNFPKNPAVTNIKGVHRPAGGLDVTRFLIGFADHLMIKVSSEQEATYAIEKLSDSLAKADLQINTTKTRVHNLMLKSRFEWLGYTYVVVPKVGSLKLKGQRFTKNRANQSTLLNYITDDNYRSIKLKIKQKIKSVKHRNLFPVLKDVNSILKGVSGYYSFGNNSARLDYLAHYTNKAFWRVLVEKYRFRGVRRTG